MPLEEKCDKLLDAYLLNVIGTYAFVKELGAVDKALDLSVKATAKMFPTRVGMAFDILKAIAPGKAFNQLVDNYAYSLQTTLSPRDIELKRVSDREATLRVNNCPVLKRVRSLVKKTGLDIDAKSFCEVESKITQGAAKEFGIDMVTELEKNGCILNAKLRAPLIIFSGV